MLFNSFIFILLFLPLSVTFYFLANKINSSIGKAMIIIASLVFYAYSDWKTLIVLGISIAANFVFAKLLEHRITWRKIYLFLPVIIRFL